MPVISPPRCVEKPHALTYHGETRVDPFYWLRERENPDVKAFLEAENEYTKSVISGRGAPELEKRLFEEMKARWKETDTSLPLRRKHFWYYSRTFEGLNFKCYCRRPVASAPSFLQDFVEALKADENAVLPKGDDEEILIDLNAVAKEEEVENVELGDYDVSPDEHTIAFTLDLSDGNETYTVIVKDLKTRAELQRIEGEIAAEVLIQDGVVFYFTMDATHRPEKLNRQKVGSPTAEVIFTEPDESFWPSSLDRSADEQFILFESGHKTRSEWYYLPIAQASNGAFQSFYPRTPLFEYNLEHHRDLFGEGKGGWLIWHNGDGCTNFRLDCLPDAAATTDRATWQPFFQYDPATNIESVSAFKQFILLSVRRNGTHTVLYFSTEVAQQITASGAAAALTANPAVGDVRSLLTMDSEAARQYNVVEPLDSGDFDVTSFRVSLGNFTIPDRLAEVNPTNGNVQVLKQEVVRGYDASKYTVERVWVTATASRCKPDDSATNLEPGKPARIPVTLVYRTDLFKRGENPCLLYSYGSYGISIDPEFSSGRVSLLDRGVVYALAAIRGGGEMGRVWRNSGRMEYKMNTFTDFVDCGRYLVAEGWAHPKKLAACGRSAGGMLMGVVTNLAPELWCTVVAGVPFVDCLTTMLDPTIPLTVPEWDEWGNPLEQPECYRIIKEYSPMDNLDESGKTVFPNLFVTSGLTDPRVAYWEPAAWVARLRRAWTASDAAGRYLCHKCVIGAGHGGSSGRYKHLEEAAAEYSFLLQSFGIDH